MIVHPTEVRQSALPSGRRRPFNGAFTAMQRHHRRLGVVGLVLIAIVLITPVFRWNALGTADGQTFNGWQLDSQALVTAKIESTTPEAQARGINALGMLIASPNPQAPNDTLDRLSHGVKPTTTSYGPYRGQSGFPGYFFTVLYHLGLTTTSALQILTSALFAGTLLLFAFLLAKATRASFGIVFLIVSLGSPWLTIAGRNLFWVPWTWFLPACAALFYIRSSGRRRLLALAALAAAFLVRWSSGYEFLTSITLLAAAMPALAAVFHPGSKPGPRSVVRETAVIIGIAFGCFLVSVAILSVQVGAGNFGYGLQAILLDAGTRTYGGVHVDNPLLKASFAANPLDVVATYLFAWNTNVFSLSFGTPLNLTLGPNSLWALVIAAVVVVVVRRVKRDVAWVRDAVVLAVALAVPLSWFIAAKAHSYVHPFINFVVWYLVTVGALIWIVGAALIPVVRAGLLRAARLWRTSIEPTVQ